MIGEILTWAGVGIAALATYALYRSAERTNAEPEDTREEHTKSGSARVARRR